MADTDTVSKIIIWASPFALTGILYLAHDAYQTVKAELKKLDSRTYNMREQQIKDGAKLGVLDDGLKALSENLADVSQVAKGIDRRSGDTKEMALYMKTVETKLNEHDANYGKVILILKKLISILVPQKRQPPQV